MTYYEADEPPLRVRIVSMVPHADGSVTLVAIDEVAEYYAAATSDLTVDLPAVGKSKPAVLSGFITQVPVDGGIRVTLDLAVNAYWRGGVVRWRVGDGDWNAVGHVFDAGAAWHMDPRASGTLHCHVLPDGGGDEFEVSAPVAGTPPAAPTGVRVTAIGGGYLAEWDTPPEIDYHHTEVLDAPYAADAPAAPTLDDDPATATSRCRLVADSWSRVDADAGDRLRVFVRHVDRAGNAGAAVHADVTPDAAGGIVWRGAWQSNVAYRADDAVSSDDRSWICTAAHTARPADPPTGDNDGSVRAAADAADAAKVDRWDLLADAGDDGVDGQGYDWRGQWEVGNPAKRYRVDDCVGHGGRAWVCLEEHVAANAKAPPAAGSAITSNTWWDLMAGKGEKGDTDVEATLYRARASTAAVSAKPAALSYNFATQTFGGLGAWSRDFPAGYDEYTETVDCFHVFFAGSGAAFAVPAGNMGPVAQCNVDHVFDAIFLESAAAPASPADSKVRVPAGWHGTLSAARAAVAGDNQVWAVFQSRDPHSGTWTRQAPVEVKGEKGDKGDPGGMAWQGPWMPDTPYGVDDAVSSDHRSWICIAAHRSGVNAADAPTAANEGEVRSKTSAKKADRWNLLADQGDDGVDGAGVDWKGPWSSVTTYAKDDAVGFGGRSWVSRADANLNHSPPARASSTRQTTWWQLLADRGADGTDGITVNATPNPVVFAGGQPTWDTSLSRAVTVEWRRGATLIGSATLTARMRSLAGSPGGAAPSYDTLVRTPLDGGTITLDDQTAGNRWGDNPRCIELTYKSVPVCIEITAMRDGADGADGVGAIWRAETTYSRGDLVWRSNVTAWSGAEPTGYVRQWMSTQDGNTGRDPNRSGNSSWWRKVQEVRL